MKEYAVQRNMTLMKIEFTEQYQKVLSEEIRPFELMKQLCMSKSTHYRYVNFKAISNYFFVDKSNYL